MKKYYYTIEYLSECLSNNKSNRDTIVESNEKLKLNDTIIVEKENQGIFLAKIINEVEKESTISYIITDRYGCIRTPEQKTNKVYKYVQSIDLSNYFNTIEKAKRKEELIKEMEKAFKEIDKQRKYEFYAGIDENFDKLYQEYKKL